MEGGPNMKRTRGHEEDEDEKKQGKKQECVNNSNDELYDVFDFPWLKEGVVFKTDDYLDDHDENFSPCSYSNAFAANFDQFCVQDLCVSPGPIANTHDDDSFWSLLFDDDLEKVDCIWSCVIDQPLEIGFHKGCIDKL